MSKTFVKHNSLDSPGVTYQRRASESASNHTPSPKQLNRSMTMVDGRTTGGPRRSRDPSSPLKRFTRAKEGISKAYHLIRDRLLEADEFLKLAHGGVESKAVGALLERTRGIEDILSRDHMKVAFFGRTSNGKSSVINALLQGKVLPAGIGHTTSCFCSVTGSESEEGYLLKPGSEEKQNVKNVQQLAHSLHKERLAPSSLVQVFWPKAKCPLLKDDVELVDSPGIDIHPNVDEVIDQHCLKADVFVLVSNAESTLMTAEKRFFHRVSERLSKPNIFILNNRWDASAQEPEKDEVKAQHLDRDIAFLAKELKVTDEQTARNRVFFVSAKEVLQYRIRVQENAPEPGEGLADGYKLRLMEFEQFERQFKECVSSAAIRTKFEQHHKQGVAVVSDLERLLELEEKQIHNNSKTLGQQLEQSWQRQLKLHSEGVRVAEFCQEKAKTTALDVEQKLTLGMKDVVSQMGGIVDHYDDHFDPASVETYKHGLCEYLDASLVEEFEKVGSTVLDRVYEETQRSLIAQYQDLLQLPDNDLNQFSQLTRPPELNYVLQCADLCEDFEEDLQFHFSLGLASLGGLVNVGSWLGSVQMQVARVGSLIPVEYALPLLLVLAGAMVPRFLNWRIILPSVALYGGVYCYERFSWTDRSKEASLKRQFVQHMRGKVQYQVRVTSSSYTKQLSGNLDLLLQRLQGSLEATLERETGRISDMMDEQTKLTQLQDRAKKLRNAVHLLQRDLEDFREDYLDHTPTDS